MSKELQIAILIAVEAHAGQMDKAGMPYILHPLKVMHYTKSTEIAVLCAAVLHDAIEDNKNMTYQYLRESGISEEVIAAIKVLTKVPGQTYDDYKAGFKSNRIARIVKKADLRHNSDIRRLKGISQKDIDRTVKYWEFFLELEAFND